MADFLSGCRQKQPGEVQCDVRTTILPGAGEGRVVVNIHFLPTSGPGPRVPRVLRGGQAGGRGGGGGGGGVLATLSGLSGPEHDSHHLIWSSSVASSQK